MNEALLRRLWLAGGWPAGALRAADGRALQVVHPGRPGHGAGPDLLDAIVALPSADLLHGDVELHVRSSDWRAHGHAGDPRYGRVVLHVVWRHDMAVDAIAGAATVALSELPEALLFERLSAPCGAEEPYHAWLRELPTDERVGLIERLGDDRLEARARRIGSDLHALGPAEALHRALLDALGYAQNRPAFAAFAEVVPASALSAMARRAVADARRALEGEPLDVAIEQLTAQLFAHAGLLDDAPLARLPAGPDRALAERYRALVGRAPSDRLAPGAWELVGVRPANRPQRRLAALAALALRGADGGLDLALRDALENPKPRLVVRALLGLFRVAPGDDYWSWHHDFGRRLPGAPMAPLGDGRAAAIVANVALPYALALADATDDDALTVAARAVWQIAPGGGPNWITAEMRPLLAGISIASARREQGAIELFKRCCHERRCLTCPAASAETAVSR